MSRRTSIGTHYTIDMPDDLKTSLLLYLRGQGVEPSLGIRSKPEGIEVTEDIPKGVRDWAVRMVCARFANVVGIQVSEKAATIELLETLGEIETLNDHVAVG